MQTIKTRNWYYADDEQPRGYIDPHSLRELWFHTGTACNLACPFCLEGSSPGDQRLEIPRLREIEPFIDEALELGVEQFSFTGGEPFLAKELVRILQRAATHRPCLVLTNGTAPLHRRFEQLRPLGQSPNPVSFRISLDYPQAEQHDAGRGEGRFAEALKGLRLLHDAGFPVSVARQMRPEEDVDQVSQAYAELFVRNGLPPDLHQVAFPDFHRPGDRVCVPQITTHCMTQYQTEESRRSFMCAFSKMVIKRQGKMRVVACTLVDDDPDYDLGATLRESLEQRVMLRHHRCYSCFAYGSSCSEL